MDVVEYFAESAHVAGNCMGKESGEHSHNVSGFVADTTRNAVATRVRVVSARRHKEVIWLPSAC